MPNQKKSGQKNEWVNLLNVSFGGCRGTKSQKEDRGRENLRKKQQRGRKREVEDRALSVPFDLAGRHNIPRNNKKRQKEKRLVCTEAR